jgi:hypothetical protein
MIHAARSGTGVQPQKEQKTSNSFKPLCLFVAEHHAGKLWKLSPARDV